MRIAIIAPPWIAVPPVAYGGTEAVIDGLARALQLAGNEVLLFATGDSTCPVERSFAYDVALGVDSAHPASELHHVMEAYDWIAAGADVVHDHTLSGPVYAERFGTPVVTTNHGRFDGENGDAYRALSGRVPIVAISHHQASTAVRTPIAAVIHHGVDLARFPVGGGHGGYALFLGRMSPDKGVHTAIAVARAAGVCLKIACRLQEAGEHAYFEAVVAPLLGADAEFVGEVGGDEKLELLAGASCLLNPIAWPEPFGMVMIEALACGTPVVSTRMGAAPEIVDHGVTGFLCETRAALAAAVLEAADLDRHACRQVVSDRFSTARMASEHLRLYEAVASRPRPLGRVGSAGGSSHTVTS